MFDFDVITGPTPPRHPEAREAARSTPHPNPPPQGGREQAQISSGRREGEGGSGG
jgi:hypothetical protein